MVMVGTVQGASVMGDVREPLSSPQTEKARVPFQDVGNFQVPNARSATSADVSVQFELQFERLLTGVKQGNFFRAVPVTPSSKLDELVMPQLDEAPKEDVPVPEEPVEALAPSTPFETFVQRCNDTPALACIVALIARALARAQASPLLVQGFESATAVQLGNLFRAAVARAQANPAVARAVASIDGAKCEVIAAIATTAAKALVALQAVFAAARAKACAAVLHPCVLRASDVLSVRYSALAAQIAAAAAPHIELAATHAQALQVREIAARQRVLQAVQRALQLLLTHVQSAAIAVDARELWAKIRELLARRVLP